MKNFKNVFFIVLMASLQLLLVNCQTEETDELISNTENSELTKVKLSNHPQLSTYVEKLQKQSSASIDSKETSLEINNGFDILYDQDIYIQQIDSSKTYSIPIHKKNQLGGTFSNLVVRFSDTEPTEAFILNYEPTDTYLDAVAIDEQTPFEGNISSESIDYDGSLDSLKENNDCVTVDIKYCDWDDNEHGDVHLAGDNCTVGYMFYVTTTICFGNMPELVDVASPGSGNPSVSDYIYTPTTGGGSLSSGDTTHPPLVVPNVPKTFTRLNIDGLTLEMSEWLNQLENYLFKQEMIDFLDEEGHLEDTELEIYLMTEIESSTQPWTASVGFYNDIPNLKFTHLRNKINQRGHIYTEFKLENGDVIARGDFADTIQLDENGNLIQVQVEPDVRTYFYSKEIRRIFRIPEIYNEYQSVSLDFLWNNFWSVVQTGVRYCTPMEDVVILIDGKDFDGVEQSRAVAGIFVVIDLVPGGKVLKITRRAGTVLSNAVPVVTRIANTTYKTQKRLFKKYRGLIESMSSTRKGNWAEMGTDVKLINKGYDEIHINRITSLDDGHQGIDHVFKNPQTGEYLIVETKYKPSGNMAYTRPANDGTGLPRQMSDEWIEQGTRLADAVGDEVADDIINTGYTRVMSIVNQDGTITFRLIDELGKVISGADGILPL